jgi:hypothetical protein
MECTSLYVKNNISTLLVNALATIPSPARIPPIKVHHLNENEVLISPDTGARIRISKKNRQHNGQKKKYKRTNNDLQNIHIKLKIE